MIAAAILARAGHFALAPRGRLMVAAPLTTVMAMVERA